MVLPITDGTAERRKRRSGLRTTDLIGAAEGAGYGGQVMIALRRIMLQVTSDTAEGKRSLLRTTYVIRVAAGAGGGLPTMIILPRMVLLVTSGTAMSKTRDPRRTTDLSIAAKGARNAGQRMVVLARMVLLVMGDTAGRRRHPCRSAGLVEVAELVGYGGWRMIILPHTVLFEIGGAARSKRRNPRRTMDIVVVAERSECRSQMVMMVIATTGTDGTRTMMRPVTVVLQMMETLTAVVDEGTIASERRGWGSRVLLAGQTEDVPAAMEVGTAARVVIVVPRQQGRCRSPRTMSLPR